MGASCSCPFAVNLDLENEFESVVERANNIWDDSQKNPLVRLVSFGDRDFVNSLEQGSMRSLKFPSEDDCLLRKAINPLPRSAVSTEKMLNTPALDQSNPKHEAAVKLQKVYKSFRTRRKLADCAVLIDQSWWKLLEFAELKHSSISFFDNDKHESAISRWARARTRAAKVGKGLSKNCKARKLALQHWLEAIDPRHRYGHNLQFYYLNWLNSQCNEPFFYWLDLGEGKEVNLIEQCPRAKLQKQCIKYLGPMERKAYEVVIEDGKFVYKQTGELLHTDNEPKGSKWIFVLSTSKTLFVGKKIKGSFQHSSFLAGGAALAAGRIVAKNGVLQAVSAHSGHYKPTPENFQDFISFLMENEADLASVQLDSVDDEEDRFVGKECGAIFFPSSSSEDDLTAKDCVEESSSKRANLGDIETQESQNSRLSDGCNQNLSAIQIPTDGALLMLLKDGNRLQKSRNSMDDYATEKESLSYEPCINGTSCMSEERGETEEAISPEEAMFQRINPHKQMVLCQLGKQVSCNWSTGAGPRIGCLRDYPSELQSQALEHAKLSPRSNHHMRLEVPSRPCTPNSSNLSRRSSTLSAPVKELSQVSEQ